MYSIPRSVCSDYDDRAAEDSLHSLLVQGQLGQFLWEFAHIQLQTLIKCVTI